MALVERKGQTDHGDALPLLRRRKFNTLIIIIIAAADQRVWLIATLQVRDAAEAHYQAVVRMAQGRFFISASGARASSTRLKSRSPHVSTLSS